MSVEVADTRFYFFKVILQSILVTVLSNLCDNILACIGNWHFPVDSKIVLDSLEVHVLRFHSTIVALELIAEPVREF